MSNLSSARAMPIVPYTDGEKAKDFYGNKLGLELMMEDPNGGLIYTAGNGTAIGVYLRPDGNKAEHTQVAFEVDDIDATVATLTENGVVFEQYDMEGLKTDAAGIVDMGMNRGAFFKDPEGNILSVIQLKG